MRGKGNNKKEELAHALYEADKKKHPNEQRQIVTFALTSFLILLIFGLSVME